ncbi:protein Daple isoform X2 [Engraulis encrasicolus]|uniref:protein Daple isoform X2 n=1 Tax=Engraulis encrasicolus TaxID=184585 RepID=UPI002FCE6DBE
MDITVSEMMANFMDSPLVVWVKTFGPLGTGMDDKLSMFMELVDGVFLHKIMTHIDPSPTNQRVHKQVNNDVNLRIQNLSVVTRHIKHYYQESLQQLILMNLPNVLTIAKDPLSGKSMEEVKRMLLLILGCAVQCERKEEMIEKIKLLDIETQAAIVSHIQEVTHNQENVLDLQWLESSELPVEELDPLSRNMAFHLRKLIDERDDSSELVVELTQERDYLQSQQPQNGTPFSSPERQPAAPLSKEERQHLAVDLADTKAKLRRYRQELEEKTEQLMDTKNEVERLDAELQKLKTENVQLLAESRSVRAYRDEVDALREKAGRVDRLETELQRVKERLHDVHFYKTRVEELREDNITLMETKSLLEEQLSTARGRCDKLHELEKENLQLRSKLHDIEMDRDTDKKRLEELLEENMLLEISQKQSMNESAHLGWELEQLSKNNDVNEARKSFVFELNESASSRLLKLEKENQGLQSTIQELRQGGLALEESQLHSQELERENQGLSKKLERLQTLLDQEKQTNQDMESLGEELLKDKQKLEKTMEKLQADKDQQISELEQEKAHLSEAVGSLRRRAQADSEARVREVEAENRALHQSISDTGGKLARLEAEQRQASKELETLRERAETCDQLERDMSRVERAREQLQREVASLKITCDRAETLERENATLEQDNRRLKKLADTAQNAATRLGTLEQEQRQLDQENLELRRQLEALKPASLRLTQLQQEYQELEREREDTRRSLEELRTQAKRSERLELNCNSLTQENQRLQQSLDNTSTKLSAVEAELQQAEEQAQTLRRELEQEARPAGRRAQALEKEKRGLEQELAQAEKERKQAEKEARWLRTQLEAKEAALDDSGLRLATLERESGVLGKELGRLKETAGRAKELERDNKELQKQATIDKRTLATLREDLVNEKLKVQQQCNEMETLSHELEKMGLNRERLLQEEHSCEDNKYKILESKIESTLKKTLDLREEKISGLESRLEESGNLNLQLRTELSTVKKTLEALRQRQEEEAAAQSQSSEQGQGQHQQASAAAARKEKWETEHREATTQLLKLKDRLIDVEKNNAALQTEKQLLKEQQHNLETQNAQLNAQTLALQRQAAALQEHNTALHTQTAKLQVESSTLGSQSASLMAQNAALQGQLASLEGDVESLQREREEARAAQEGALRQHEKLLGVHERQAAEYEQLITQHTALKAAQRSMEQKHRTLENKYMVLVKQKDGMEALEATLQRERKSLEQEIQKNTLILAENHSLRDDMERLSQNHGHLRQEYDGLQVQTKELKTSLNSAQLELNRWQARYDQLKDQHQGLDISMTKLDNHCELLTRLKGNLEEENHHLLSQIQMLSQQNQTLLERTMESKEMYHEEQKQYIDKLNSLRRQKEKLEEKIMDQYKFYDPTPKKRNHWSGAKALAKLIKPKKESGSRCERDRVRSAPDIPLPDPPPLQLPPDCPNGPPPLPPPPLPPRQSRLSLESTGSRSPDDNHLHSPSLNANHASRAYKDGGMVPSRSRDLYRTPGGSNESVNGTEDLPLRRRQGVGEVGGGPSCSTPINHAPDSRMGRRPRGLNSDDDLRLLSPDAGYTAGLHGNTGSQERLQPRSASLSSDDAMAMGHEIAAGSMSRSSTLPYDPPGHRSASRPAARHRSSSPGSEMVTLEEFLQESNTLSPPTVQTGSREDLMNDYFTRSTKPSAPRDGLKTPTSYVTPTVKTPNNSSLSTTTSSAQHKPGHSVKPSVRQPSAPDGCHSLTLPNRSSASSSAATRPSPRGAAGSSGGGGTSLSRTFSLASADLLRSNGPDSYRGDHSSSLSLAPNQSDVVLRRGGGGGVARERPLSARMAGSSNHLGDGSHLDPRRLSVAPPRDELSLPPPQHHSSSLSLQPDRYTSGGSRGGGGGGVVGSGGGTGGSNGTPRTPSGQAGRSAPQRHHNANHHHRGEVAMVTPVRAVPALRLEEEMGEEGRRDRGEPRQAESPLLKKGELGGGGGGGGGVNGSTEERPKSTPASPDPNNDPQTVWYEYGCV